MSRREKIYERLALLEAEFHKATSRHVERVATGANSDFFQTDRFSEFHNGYLLPQRRPIEALLELGEEINHLRALLDEPPSDAVLSLESACREATDYRNPHRLGSKRLAQRVLATLRERAS